MSEREGGKRGGERGKKRGSVKEEVEHDRLESWQGWFSLPGCLAKLEIGLMGQWGKKTRGA